MKVYRLPNDYNFQWLPCTDTHNMWLKNSIYKPYRAITWGFWMFRLWPIKDYGKF